MATSYENINSLLREARHNRLRRSVGEERTFVYGVHAISVKEYKEMHDRSSVSDIEESLTRHIYEQIRLERDREESKWYSRFNFDEKNVIQLGSGIGLAGIFLKISAPTAKVAIAESADLVPLVQENVAANIPAEHKEKISVHCLELQEDLSQSHIKVRAYDFVLAVLDIYNAPQMTEKLFKVILELSGNGSLLLFGYKRYLKVDDVNPKKKRVEDFQSREKEFRESLGRFFSLRKSFQAVYKLSATREIVIVEINRTPFSTYLEQR